VLVEMGTKRRAFYMLAWAGFVAGLLAMIAGFWLRIEITGRAPVTNMYESVVYLALGITAFGMIFEAFNRQRYLMAAAAAIGAVALILADSAPVVLDPQLHPLKAVLRDNFWLVVHVMTITLSYAAFALAMGIGDITLWFYLVGSRDRAAIEAQSRFTYRVLQVGVLLLAVGTILGAVWADFAWGRFWGWDAKEVWALVSLIYYLAVLHARFIGWVRQLGLAAASSGGFLFIIVAWYGSNYWFAGLHSYGSGPAGGTWYVVAGMLLQAVYVVVATVRGSELGPKTLAAEDG
jgi:ABC-type transport system involved in cytochrome c biogenesis permease subunit